ncbi:MAG: hypothetical protein FWD57_01985 [Polyangiaceae bacterium]|nr:hypothetical protein [Polyangiaceae bacterium]
MSRRKSVDRPETRWPVADWKVADWKVADLPLVARVSLMAVAVSYFCNPSCLVTSIAEFPEPVETPPFLDANTARATPKGSAGVPVTKLIQVDSETDDVTLWADVRSDDVGRELFSRVYINYNNVSVSSINPFFHMYGGRTFAPGTFEQSRPVTASFDPSLLPDGCYQVSFVVTHGFNHDTFLPLDHEDTAILVWWMVKGDPSQFRIDVCPGMTPSPRSNSNDGGV